MIDSAFNPSKCDSYTWRQDFFPVGALVRIRLDPEFIQEGELCGVVLDHFHSMWLKLRLEARTPTAEGKRFQGYWGVDSSFWFVGLGDFRDYGQRANLLSISPYCGSDYGDDT